MALNSIETEWHAFAGMVLAPLKPSETQFLEMRKAFYAGSYTMLCAVLEIGNPHASEAEAEAFLDARRAECNAFKTRLMADQLKRN